MFPSVRWPLLGLAALLLGGCASQPIEPGPMADGELAGQSLSVPLDDPKARYYLTTYPESHPEGWHEWLAEIEAQLEDGVVDGGELGPLIDENVSVDLAALLFIYGVLSDPQNRRWQECLNRVSDAVSLGYIAYEDLLPEWHSDYKIVFAPGYLYEDHPQTEADFSRTRQTLSSQDVPYHFIPSVQDASVEENAEQIADVIRSYRDDGRELILVSASKSASEVHWAMGHLLSEEESAHVVAWLNAGGVVAGTPLVDRWTRFPRSLMARGAFLWYGWSFDSLRSMRTDRSQDRLSASQLPEDLFILNYVAVPMRAQVSPAAQERHRYLARYGPSDGLAPLWKTKVYQGVTMVEPGADHYFHAVDIRLRTLVLMAMTLNHLQGKGCPDVPEEG
ncbi:hypothetical protein J2T60_000317 [Natronospira proteinivora]|uniref:Uncharacterized protein n=1 Tax=Natronospira proteinivora TaxID=1807133 RepID=A0ABT1G8R9_9GAMM|nr:hypothetical protein [Natronospira proteinivora]MCP1726352.1 hypothetical protein [Natronospira proteinivora]